MLTPESGNMFPKKYEIIDIEFVGENNLDSLKVSPMVVSHSSVVNWNNNIPVVKTREFSNTQVVTSTTTWDHSFGVDAEFSFSTKIFGLKSSFGVSTQVT